MSRDPPDYTSSGNNNKRKRSSRSPASRTHHNLQTLLEQQGLRRNLISMPANLSEASKTDAPAKLKLKTRTLRCLSLGNKHLDIVFSVAGPEDICGISQVEIIATEVDFVTNNPPLFPKDPQINKAVIAECGHCFHALSLVYHFLRNSMACPMCRHGDCMSPLAVSSFPRNETVSELHVTVQRLERTERADAIRAETADIRNGLYMQDGTEFVMNSTYDLTTLIPTLAMYTYHPNTIALSTPVLQNACMLVLNSIDTPAAPLATTQTPFPSLALA